MSTRRPRIGCSVDRTARRQIAVDRRKAHTSIRILRSQQHAVGHHTPDFTGFEIGYEDDTLTDEVRGIVVLGDTGKNCAGFRAEIDRGTQQFIGTGQFFTRFDLTRPPDGSWQNRRW